MRTSNEKGGLFSLLFFLAFIYLQIASIAWLCRNPTANAMTTWTRFQRVIRFEKLSEYQVVKTYHSMAYKELSTPVD